MKLRINNIDADTQNNPIAMTFQAAKVGEVNRVNASFSNVIQLPKSATNDAIFNNPMPANSETPLRYNTVKATLQQLGVDILGNGQCLVTEVTPDEYNIALFSGNFDIINWLGEKTLQDIFFDAPLFNWDSTDITTLLAADLQVSKAVYAVYRTKDEINNLQSERMFPVVQVVEILQRMFDGSGITLAGEFLTHPFVTTLAIPACYNLEATGFRFAYSGDVIDLVTPGPPFSTFIFTNQSDENEATLTTFENEFAEVQGSTVVIRKPIQSGTLLFNLSCNEPAMPSNALLIQVQRGAVTLPLTMNLVSNTTTNESWLSDAFDFFPGDVITFDVDITQIAPDQQTLFFVRVNRKNEHTKPFVLSDGLPNIKQVDFLKSLLLMFCAYPSTDLNTTYYNLYNQLSRANVIDITHLIQENTAKVQFKPQGYGAVNNFKYDGDENTTGNASFAINTRQTDAEQNFSVSFRKPVSVTMGGRLAVHIPIYDPANGNILKDVKNYIGFVMKDAPTTLTLDGTINITGPTNYFRFEPFLNWQNLHLTFWNTLIQSLNKAYYLDITANLSSNDIALLRDFRKVVTIKTGKFAGVYFVEQIEQFNGVTPCKLKLFRLTR